MSCITDKIKAKKLYEYGLLLRSNQIFKYENFPQNLDPNQLEYMLQNKGKIYIIKRDDDFIICDNYSENKISNQIDYYGKSKSVNIINSYHNELNDTYSIYPYTDYNQCVEFKNNYLALSVIELLSKYEELIIESELSLRTYILNSRNVFTLIASDNKSKQNCELFLKKLERGDLSVLMDNTFLESIKMLDNKSSGDYGYKMLQIIQYLKASCLHEIGINANYEIKRSVTSQADIDLNLDYLIPLIDNMFTMRQKSISDLNKCFNLNCEVMLHSTWLNERLKAEDLIHNTEDNNITSEGTENDIINSDDEQNINKELSENE